MNIKDEREETLIKLRLNQAFESIQEAELLIANKMFRAATNRIYFGMFYALLALAIKYHFKTSKHTQLIGWFNRVFIKENLIEKKFGKIINSAFELRTEGDYIAFIQFDNEDLNKNLNDMKAFIEEIERHIFSNQ
jgi:uncharacterized protein (UPF0332 family)